MKSPRHREPKPRRLSSPLAAGGAAPALVDQLSAEELNKNKRHPEMEVSLSFQGPRPPRLSEARLLYAGQPERPAGPAGRRTGEHWAKIVGHTGTVKRRTHC